MVYEEKNTSGHVAIGNFMVTTLPIFLQQRTLSCFIPYLQNHGQYICKTFILNLLILQLIHLSKWIETILENCTDIKLKYSYIRASN